MLAIVSSAHCCTLRYLLSASVRAFSAALAFSSSALPFPLDVMSLPFRIPLPVGLPSGIFQHALGAVPEMTDATIAENIRFADQPVSGFPHPVLGSHQGFPHFGDNRQ